VLGDASGNLHKEMILMRIIMRKDNYGYILIRQGGQYSQHAHFDNEKAASLVRKLTYLGIKSEISRFEISQKRLLTEEEFLQLK